MTFRIFVALALATTLSGCADALRSTSPGELRPLTTSLAPLDDESPETTIVPEWPLRIRSTYIGLRSGLGGEGQAPAIGYLETQMSYDGYHARITAAASSVGAGYAFSNSFFPREKDSFWQFQGNYHDAGWTWNLPSRCGMQLRADILFEVEWQYLADVTDSESKQQSAEIGQAACDAGAGQLISYPGGGGTMRCVTTTTEHYFWHPDTGLYEYRYTTVETECYPIQYAA